MPNPKTHPPKPALHISGAEGIFSEGEIQQSVRNYIDRALTHPRGKADSITITIEQLHESLIFIKTLPVITVKCRSTAAAEMISSRLLAASGVSMKAIASAWKILQSKDTMRGACLMHSSTGRRMEPDRQRGIRASRFGINTKAEKTLSAALDVRGINTLTVREALVLASKVASCEDVIGEVCMSDDPDYTTGYVASSDLGYIRIPLIKKKRDRRGGRVFFLRDSASVKRVMEYLEKTPVLVNSISPCFGEMNIDEILDRSHQ